VKHKSIRLPQVDTSRDPVPDQDQRWFLGGPNLYHDGWLYLQQGWAETVRAYEANPESFYNAWHYLNEHPIYWQLWREPDPEHLNYRNLDHGFGMLRGIDVDVVRVNPADQRISEDPALNTLMQVWLETGEIGWPGNDRYHNCKLDCGGATYEEAIVRLARRVHGYYGNDRRRCDPQYTARRRERTQQRLRRRYGPAAGKGDTDERERSSGPAG